MTEDLWAQRDRELMQSVMEHPPGSFLVGRPWHPDDEVVSNERWAEMMAVHRFKCRDERGLGITHCGIHQQHRSNHWAWLDRDNERQKQLPICNDCFLMTPMEDA